MDRKNKWALGVILVIGLGIFAWEFRKLSFAQVWRELINLNWIWLLIALSCMLIHWGIEAKILQGLLQRHNSSYSFINAYRIPLIEHLFNAITPFSSGGQPAQLMALKKTGVDFGVGGSVLLMKFVVYQGMIVLNFVSCVLFGYQALSNQLSKLSTFVLIGLVVNIGVISLLLLITFKAVWLKKIIHWVAGFLTKFIATEKIMKIEISLLEKVDSFYEESLYIRSQRSLLIKTSLLTFIQLIFYFVVPYFILRSLGISEINILTIISLHAFIILIVSLFPLPGGAGGAEYSFTLLFGSFILSPEKLVIALILWRLITHYTGIFMGIAALSIQSPKSKTTT
ncbi:lysylphosphatidylglycerol synthase transmembrane domain-containing protein [Carnobacterium gallinarum]|uniref:lysylphosphatidylglycerol synthase transmembrane domain-containing protein n=1 Tax=Carnobacterium gallinarum TaxID=2749 RepID=UPI0005542E5E|nr:lysylphosphatidylglycerol synthase transmembrane domain-containing protein [Carnobacterium gallinarum]